MLENFLTIKKGHSDFVDRLIIGGVNIIDFRKMSHTTDDLFSIMTLIVSVLSSKKRYEDEVFVFVINEAHDYFTGSVSDEFVESIEFLIRRKRHRANWLLLDTHFPDDVAEKVISLSDIKMVNTMDITSLHSRVLNDAYKESPIQFSQLTTGQTLICADESSLGKFKPILVNIRPRVTEHGAPTQTAK